MHMATLRRRIDGVMIRQVVGDILLLDTESGQIHQLNETAGFIWRRCEDAPSVEGIAELLAMEFEVRQDIALKDVAETLSKLRALNLVVET
jgi:hypothetical protein